MSSEFELKILKDKITALATEKEQLVHSLTLTEREEQAELEKVNREFSIRASTIKGRQRSVDSELINTQRTLDSLERRIQVEQKKKEAEEVQRKANDDMRRRLR